MTKIRSAAVLVLGASLAQWAGATETVVDRDGRMDFGSAAIASGDAVFVDSGAASVTKTGAGEWTLPLGNFFAFGSGFEFGLLGGTLNLTDGTSPDYVTTPPTVLNDAAFWVAAGKNIVTNASGYVTQWYDARESAAAAVSYGYAEAYSTVLSQGAEGPVAAVKEGRTAVAFKAYASSNLTRSFELRTVAGGGGDV